MPADSLNTPILSLSAKDSWTLADACEGTIIFGGNGSGKTPGRGQAIPQRFLERGYGGVALRVRVDEGDRWREYARRAGRMGDMRVVEPSGELRLNFLDY